MEIKNNYYFIVALTLKNELFITVVIFIMLGQSK